MTRHDLEQLQKLRVEVIDLAREIDKASKTHIIDVVLGSRHVIPYDLHPIVVEGLNSDKVTQLRFKLTATCDRIQQVLLDIEEWVEGIEDSEMRSIIRMYFQQGLTQETIGKQIGYSRQRVGQKLDAFLAKMKD